MYFNLLKVILAPQDNYRVYIDIKDTRGAQKASHLHEVLCNNMYDFERKIVQRIQTVRSHEVGLVQLTDILLGAVAYENRRLSESTAKLQLVNLIKQRSGYLLTKSTLFRENKFNIFQWHPRREGQ